MLFAYDVFILYLNAFIIHIVIVWVNISFTNLTSEKNHQGCHENRTANPLPFNKPLLPE